MIRPVLDAIKSQKLSKLQFVALWYIALNNEEGRALAEAIASGHLPSMKHLHLYQTDLRAGDFSLAEAMESGTMLTLERIELDKVGMGGASCEAYANVMSSGKLPSLLVIHFKWNQIGNSGAKALGSAIRSGKLKNLARLDLGYNEIADDGLIALVDAFQAGTTSVLPSLQQLCLCGNHFTEKSLQLLAEALESGRLNSLELLDLSTVNSERGARALLSAMARNSYLAVDVLY